MPLAPHIKTNFFLTHVDTVLPNRNTQAITRIREMDQAIRNCHCPCHYTACDSGRNLQPYDNCHGVYRGAFSLCEKTRKWPFFCDYGQFYNILAILYNNLYACATYIYNILKKFRTILTGILAALVLTSSISHSISIHFCGGEIESVAVFGQAKQCPEHDNACHYHGNTNHTSISHKGCCEDATFKIDSDKYTYKITDKITVDGSQYIFLPVAYLVQEVNPFISFDRHFSRYKPPLIERDITILVQTFLI